MSFTVSYNIKAIDQYTDVADKVERATKKMETAMGKLGGRSSRVTKTIKNLEDSTASLSGKQVESTKVIKNKISSSKALERANAKMHRAEERASAALARLNRENHLSMVQQTKQKIALHKKQIRSIEKLARAEESAARASRQRVMAAGQGMSRAGSLINTRFTLPVVAAGVASVKMSMDINKSMAAVSTLMDEPAGKIDEMKNKVQSMAVATGQSTEDLSSGLYEVISALGESEQNMGQLDIAARAAVAGVASTTDAIKLFSAAGKGYNDVSEKALRKTSDLAFMTAVLGQTTFPEMAASMGDVIPLAAQFETTQEELFATMATLTGVTGNTAKVSTQLASVYAAFMKPTTDMDKALNKINKDYAEYNFQTAGGMLKTLGFKKSLELMNEAADGNEEKLGAIFTRKEAILGVLPLITTQSGNYAKKLEAMKNASGATEQAFKRQTEGINEQGFRFEQTKRRMEVFAQRTGDKLLPVAEKLMNYLDPIVDALADMDDEAFDAAMSMVGFAIKTGLAVSAIGKFMTLTSGMSSFLTNLPAQAGGGTAAVKGLGGALGAIGPLAAALGVGWGLGEALNTFLIKPLEDASDKLANTVGNMLVKLGLEIDKLDQKGLEKKDKELRVKLDEMQGFGANIGALFDGSFGADFNRTKIALARQIGEVGGRIETKKRRADPKSWQNQETQQILNMREQTMDTETMRELLGAGGRGGGGSFPGMEQQKLKIEVEVKTDGGVTATTKTESTSYADVETGKNTRG